MYFQEILRLAEEAAKGITDIEKGTLSSNGYGFVFRDLGKVWEHTEINHSSKFWLLGFERKSKIDDFLLGAPPVKYSSIDDVRLAGALKRLVPTMVFGGWDIMFEVWVFVITPEGLQFPIVIYYGPTRLSLGGWNFKVSKALFDDVKDHCKELKNITNFSPFELKKNQREELAEAIELGLKNVPVSDFYGIYKRYEDYFIMGIKDKRPSLIKFDWESFNDCVDDYFNRVHGSNRNPDEVMKEFFPTNS